METISPEELPRASDCEPIAIQVEPGKVYSWCSCGLTEKSPFCDSNHKKVVGTPFRSVKVMFREAQEVWFCQCKRTRTPPFCDQSHLEVEKK
jgi:CDGSH-type Zn-finger protein